MSGFAPQVTVTGEFEWDGSMNLSDVTVLIDGNEVGDFDDALSLLTNAIDALEEVTNNIDLGPINDALSAVNELRDQVESAQQDLDQ